MASAARTLGAFLRKVSLSRGLYSSLASLKNPSTLQRFGLFEKATVADVLRLRRIWTSPPVCMGRRSCKIAGRKDAQNLKKMKRNGKIGKEIVAARMEENVGSLRGYLLVGNLQQKFRTGGSVGDPSTIKLTT